MAANSTDPPKRRSRKGIAAQPDANVGEAASVPAETETAEDRMARIERLKARIAAGEYRVSAAEIADKMIARMRDRKP